MSELLSHTNLLGDALLAPLSATSTGGVLDTEGTVVTATPAAVVTAAGAGAVAGYVAGQNADD